MNQTQTNTKRNLNEIDNDDTRNFAINLSEDLKTEGLGSLRKHQKSLGIGLPKDSRC